MDGARSDPPHQGQTDQAAGGGPKGVRWFERYAEVLFENRYQPLPIKPGKKAPAPTRWTELAIDNARIAAWIRSFGDHGVGLRTGRLVGLDIDILDPDRAHEVMKLAEDRLGETLMRVGLWPKRLLLYRTETPFPKIDVKPLEVLGQGQQFVAFGIHESTGKAYSWPLGDTPLDVPMADLPAVTQGQMLAFVAEARAIVPEMGEARSGGGRRKSGGDDQGVVRDEHGKVVDGRERWLSQIAYHTVHDALDRQDDIEPDRLAEIAWGRFSDTTDLTRPRQDSGLPWFRIDAERKVAEKLKLHREHRLPPRQRTDIETDYVAPTQTAAEARDRLETEIAGFCAAVLQYHADGPFGEPLRLGLRATTGLGKSSIARRLFADLRRQLTAMNAPDRFLVFTPSHDLAEETAVAWRELGLTVAVLRGHERMHPVHKVPMCRDKDAMNAALAAGQDPQRTVCKGKADAICPLFNGCLKQQNRNEVRGADVVVAPYDALYSGFAVGAESIAALIVDEGCWSRATRIGRSLTVEELTVSHLTNLGVGMDKLRAASRRANHEALRSRLQRALCANGPGPVARRALVDAGLTEADCQEAAGRERGMLVDPGLVPGLTGKARVKAFAQARANERIRSLARVWDLAGELLMGDAEASARLRVEPEGDLHRIETVGTVTIDDELAGKPVLHLDATLRLEIASRLLPGLQIATIEAAAPYMATHLVTGRFGKTAIVPDDKAAPDENARRQRNLADCVDHVRWQAHRLAPGRILVITYKAVEVAFADIPGVVTGHFNAMAGLDGFKDVAAIFIIGRPLPRDTALQAPCAALFDHVADGSYGWQTGAVRMRDGSSRAVRVMRHQDATAEVIRAAICDDELIQDVGRGRGVNRTEDSRLEVHVLSDVALPLVHDTVVRWETVAPDVVQRMLLAGIAVDSPADAVALHPQFLTSGKQAQKAFERIGFKRQIPMSTYRGMSLKSAAYKRGGRGRSWQRAWWMDGDADPARRALEAALGPMADWCED